MFKILQPILQQSVNRELPDVPAGFRKDRGTRDQTANIRWIMEKAREIQKNNCFIDYCKAFGCVDHNKLWEILKEMGIPEHLTCLLCFIPALTHLQALFSFLKFQDFFIVIFFQFRELPLVIL